MQAYSDPKREADPRALPDIEVFEAQLLRCNECGLELPDLEFESAVCPRDGKLCLGTLEPVMQDREIAAVRGSTVKQTHKVPVDRWWWWTCSPGCLPEGDPRGPFYTEEEALADAREEE